jgi:DNA-binding response OmpR family regulator
MLRIVLLNDKRSERESMVRALPQESYRVEAVSDEQSALAAIAREAPQVVIFGVPAKGGPDLVRRLRGADSSGQAYQLALIEAVPAGKEISNLVAAGVHDFMRRPVIDCELLERVNAPARLIRWAQSVVKPAVFDFSSTLDMTKLRAWRGLGALVAEDLAQMAGQAFSASEGWPQRFTEDYRSATIPMSLAGDQLEVRVSVVADARMLAWLRESLLGDPSANDEATDDALRELANTAGGAIKRAALCENVALTTGLPVNEAVEFPGKHQCWSLSLDAERGSIALVAEIRKRENQRIPASKLIEGMILAHDVRSEGGILLVPAGSRLTSTSAVKLAQMLGSRFLLEVAPAA